MRHTLGLGNDRGDADGIGFLDTLSALNQALRSEIEQYSPRPAGRRPRARNRVMKITQKTKEHAAKGQPRGRDIYCSSVDAIADYVGQRLGCPVTTRTIFRWMKSRNFPYRKVGGSTVASQHEIDQWIDGA